MLSDADRKKAADILMAAEKERKQAVQLSTTWPNIAIEDSYAISTEVAKRKIAAGAKLIGHKVGLTSKAMQRSSMIDEPDYGHLLDNMMIADGARFHTTPSASRGWRSSWHCPWQDAERPGIGLTDVLSATEYVVPAIEIVDARLQIAQDFRKSPTRRGGRYRGRRPPCRPARGGLRWVGASCTNSEIERPASRRGLGHPALGVALLANSSASMASRSSPASGAGGLVHPRRVRREGRYLARRLGPLGGIAVQFV